MDQARLATAVQVQVIFVLPAKRKIHFWEFGRQCWIFGCPALKKRTRIGHGALIMMVMRIRYIHKCSFSTLL